MSVSFVPVILRPDLVFGLVGPIGVDIEYIQERVSDTLASFEYNAVPIRITDLMKEIKSNIPAPGRGLASQTQSKMDYANDLRARFDANDILAALAIGAIAQHREAVKKEGQSGTAYIIRQLKTPEEIALLRSVYGRQFVQISIYAPRTTRHSHLTAQIKLDAQGAIKDEDASLLASNLIRRDAKEEDTHGQNIRAAYPLGDFFVDSGNREHVGSAIGRFMNLLFGDNEISPTHDEYGMYLAKSAALRSSDLSRQIGAAIFSSSGEIISLGSNEVPKAGGGTYWTGDAADSRDIRQGLDPNELQKKELFAEIINTLYDDGRLAKALMDLGEVQDVVNELLNAQKYRDLRVMDIIEFGRVIHAEMSAICDAARNGLAVRGSTLLCTTFPCHVCAKHIVAAGIKRVVYLEPYPKSYAEQLHRDSIQVDDDSDSSKVAFQPFIGIAPFRYKDLFEKGRRKDAKGVAKKWKSEPRRPAIEVAVPVPAEAERLVIAQLGVLLDDEGHRK
jgi:cytidine deaminase